VNAVTPPTNDDIPELKLVEEPNSTIPELKLVEEPNSAIPELKLVEEPTTEPNWHSFPAPKRGVKAKTPQLELWNPAAAVNWSILFTSMFGMILHAHNWHALGKPILARINTVWAWITLPVLLTVTLLLPAMGNHALVALGLIAYVMVFLFGWYFTLGLYQINYVKEHHRAGYRRRDWLQPLGIAVLLLFVLAGVRAAIDLSNSWLDTPPPAPAPPPASAGQIGPSVPGTPTPAPPPPVVRTPTPSVPPLPPVVIAPPPPVAPPPVARPQPAELVLQPNQVGPSAWPALPAPLPLQPPTQVPTEPLKLPEKARQVCVGGGGRFVLFVHANTVSVFDANEAKIVRTVPLPEPNAPVTATMTQILFYAADDKLLHRVELLTGNALPPLAVDDAPVEAFAAGHASDGPLLIGTQHGSRFYSLADGRELVVPTIYDAGKPFILPAGKYWATATGLVWGWQTLPANRQTVSTVGMWTKKGFATEQLRAGPPTTAPILGSFTGKWATHNYDQVQFVPRSEMHLNEFNSWPRNTLSAFVPSVQDDWLVAVKYCEPLYATPQVNLANPSSWPGGTVTLYKPGSIAPQQAWFNTVLRHEAWQRSPSPDLKRNWANLEQRVLLLPAAKLLILVDELGERVQVLRWEPSQPKLDLGSELIWLSNPPRQYLARRVFIYVPQVNAPPRSGTFTLEMAPIGMIVEPLTDKVTWLPPMQNAPATVEVVLKYTPRQGDAIRQTIKLTKQ
jgi:hypothetical protein